MQFKYRTKTEIIRSILEQAREGKSVTKLMYLCFLSYTQTKQYINFLLDKGFLKEIKNTVKLQTTEKGIKYIHAVENLESIVGGD